MTTNTNSFDLTLKDQSQPILSNQPSDSANTEKRGRFTIKSVSKEKEKEKDSSGAATPAVENKSVENPPIPPDTLKEKDGVKSKAKEPIEQITSQQPSPTVNGPAPTVGNEELKVTEEGKVKKKSRFTVKAVPIQEDESNVTTTLTTISQPNTVPSTTQQPPPQLPASSNINKQSQHSENSNVSFRPPSVIPPVVEGGGNTNNNNQNNNSNYNLDYTKMEKLLELNYQMLNQMNEIMRNGSQTSRSNSILLPSPSQPPTIPPLNSLTSVSQPGNSTPLIIAPTPSRGSLYNRSSSSNNNVPSRPSSSQGKEDKTPTDPPTSSSSAVMNSSASSNNLKQTDSSNPPSSNSKPPPSSSSLPPSSATSTTANNNNSNNTLNSEEKDKGYGKMSYYLNELRKELEHERSSKRDKAIELQRIRERCQQYEELYRIEQQKAIQFQDSYERIQQHYKQLEQSYLEQQLLLHQANQKLEELTNKAGVVVTPVSDSLAITAVPSSNLPPSTTAAATTNSTSNSTSATITIETTATVLGPASGIASSTVSPNNQMSSNYNNNSNNTNSNSHRGSLSGKTDESVGRKEDLSNLPPSKLVHKLSARDLFETTHHSSNGSSPSYTSTPSTSMKQSNPIQSTPSGKTAYTPLVEGNILNDNVNLFVHINDPTTATNTMNSSNPLHHHQSTNSNTNLNNSHHGHYSHNTGSNSNGTGTPVNYRHSITSTNNPSNPNNNGNTMNGMMMNQSHTNSNNNSSNTASLGSYSHSSSSHALHSISQRD